MDTDPKPLQERIREWISAEVGTDAAAAFADAFAGQLRREGAPVTDEQWQTIKAEAKEAGLTPAFIRTCADEYRRATERGWTLRQWMEDAFGRVLLEGQARQRVEVVRRVASQVEGANKMSEPVQPEDIVGYRLVLNQFGGSAGLLALQEGQNRLF